MAKVVDITNKKYTRLTALEFLRVEDHHAFWRCVCDCGNTVEARGYDLRRGHKKSCGCLFYLRSGSAYSREYAAWRNAKDRCNNERNHAYDRYGGRGIKMYPQWENSFSDFYDYIGPKPSPKHSLDRIDNSKGYEPGNVRWATPKQQTTNRRSNRTVTYKGETKTLSEWSQVIGGSKILVSCRLRKGWSEERAVSTPADKSHDFSSYRKPSTH